MDIDPDLRRRIKIAAAERDQSVRDFVAAILQRAMADEDRGETTEGRQWAQLSARSFARDWESAEEQVYDGLS